MSKAAKNFEEKCKTFFDQANGGKPITPGQLCRVIRKACPNFQGSDQDIAQMFLEVDANSDRLITWEEFSEALFAKDPKEVTRAELEQQFKEIDKDGSGKLSKSEVKALCQDQGMNISDEGLDNLMAAADPDGDGVNFQEFLAAWASE